MGSSCDQRATVCMFVYNDMRHDARVRKEARTLARAGYAVTVLAVRDASASLRRGPGPTPKEEVVHGFRILRISRSILGVGRQEIKARLRRVSQADASPVPQARGRSGIRARVLKALDTAGRMPFYPLRRVVVFFRFVRAALQTRADVYHAHDLNTLLMAWVSSRLRRVPLVYDTHEVATEREAMKFRWWARLLERALIHRAHGVICTNRTRADYTQQRYHIRPPTVLRNFPDYVEPEPSTLMREALGLPHEEKIVLYQGGIQPGRGLEQLIEAAAAVKGGVIVLLGSGRLAPHLRQRVAEQGLGGRVLFHEAVPVEELPQWTACAYVGLQILQNTCFNHYSSLSNKLLEYMMAGVPAIASDLPEMRRVIEDTGAGLLIDASDPRQIAAAVNRVLADERLRGEMSGKAKAARRRYSWEEEQHILLEMYAALLGAESHGAGRSAG